MKKSLAEIEEAVKHLGDETDPENTAELYQEVMGDLLSRLGFTHYRTRRIYGGKTVTEDYHSCVSDWATVSTACKKGSNIEILKERRTTVTTDFGLEVNAVYVYGICKLSLFEPDQLLEAAKTYKPKESKVAKEWLG